VSRGLKIGITAGSTLIIAYSIAVAATSSDPPRTFAVLIAPFLVIGALFGLALWLVARHNRTRAAPARRQPHRGRRTALGLIAGVAAWAAASTTFQVLEPNTAVALLAAVAVFGACLAVVALVDRRLTNPTRQTGRADDDYP
jgi:cobalamin synthase